MSEQPQSAQAMRTERIAIPWMGPSMNAIWAGVHWRKRKRIADEGHLACLVARKVQPFSGPVCLEFSPLVKGRRFDCTNFAVTAKVIEDALVKMKVIPGDGPEQVRSVLLCAPEKGSENVMVVTIIGQ